MAVTKLNWTCLGCGMWHSTNRDHLEISNFTPQLICQMCGHNSTDELVAGEPVYHLISIPMIKKGETQDGEGSAK